MRNSNPGASLPAGAVPGGALPGGLGTGQGSVCGAALAVSQQAGTKLGTASTLHCPQRWAHS